MLIIRYVIRMHSYVTSIYMHVICMPLLCHSNVLACYSHNINMSLAYNLYAFAYHLYVINMSTVCHSYVLVYYPHAIRMSLLYQSFIIRMQLVCNQCLLHEAIKADKMIHPSNGCYTMLKRYLAVLPMFSKLFRSYSSELYNLVEH